MKKIYWRPRAVSRPALVLIALISISGLVVVERWKVRSEEPYIDEKRAAAELALDHALARFGEVARLRHQTAIAAAAQRERWPVYWSRKLT